MIPEHPGAGARLWVHVHGHRLDRALADGFSPDAGAALSLRAQELIGERARRSLARALRRLLEDAARTPVPLDPGFPMCRRKVLASRRSLLAAAARLEADEPVDARGVTQVGPLV